MNSVPVSGLRLDHIGIVVKDLEKACQEYQLLHGLKAITDRIHEPAHDVDILFLETGHGSLPNIELIMPLSDSSKVSKFLKKTGGGIHHLASCLRSEIMELRAVQWIGQPMQPFSPGS